MHPPDTIQAKLSTAVSLLLGAILFVAPMLLEAQDWDAAQKPSGAPAVAVKVPPASVGSAKLSVELRELSGQFTTTRGETPQTKYTSNQLQRQFGISNGQKQPAVEVAISTTGNVDTGALTAAGAQVWFQAGKLVFARVPVARLQQVAQLENVKSIANVSPVEIPPNPKAAGNPQLKKFRGAPPGEKLADRFDHQGLTGKGVILGIIDSGIDWRHQDFINPDGTTRIRCLYDPFDNSWQDSGGKIGSEPPYYAGDVPVGTVYSRDQINDALAGKGTVNSTDKHGHGTACAGTAAGNGRATANDVPTGAYPGVATGADLIIMKLFPDDGSKKLLNSAHAARYILATAKSFGQPCVLNLSLGSHYSAHDGNDSQELALDSFLGAGNPGFVAVIAAGNERGDNIHAAGRFGPEGQPDNYSSYIELNVTEFTRLVAYFDSRDDWGLAVLGLDEFFVSPEGRPVQAYFFPASKSVGGLAWSGGAEYLGPITKIKGMGLTGDIPPPASFNKYLERFADWERLESNRDRLVIALPPGKYLVRGYGEGKTIVDGKFDLYVMDRADASFGLGVRAASIVGTPGNSTKAITVGSYDFRREWQNALGTTTTYNLPLGDISDYSSPGYRLDGVVKPEITAPAQYTISSLANNSEMGKKGGGPNLNQITRDGQHIAWSGTSAATPYVAGVVALMLQKNPNLDSDQIKKILIETARKDEFTGAVPNREWGYGKIDPAAALAKTPAVSAASEPKVNATKK